MTIEVWKPVVGYEQTYSVSNMGRIRRETSVTCGKQGRIMKITMERYPSVCLSQGGKVKKHLVHAIVAAAFLGPRPDGMITNHIDADRHNWRASNLEYITQSQNVKHAYDNGLRDCRGEGNGQAKLTEADVKAIRAAFNEGWGSKGTIARSYGVSTSVVSEIIAGKSWSHV